MKDEDKLKDELANLKSLLDLHESGFFYYKYQFESIDKYEDALRIVKDSQSALIKSGGAFICKQKDLEGSPIIKNLSKLTLLAFNGNAELVIGKVKYNNYDSCDSKIKKIFEQINSMLDLFRCEITVAYLESKLKELAIGLEFEQEKQRIKEEQDEIKKQIREEQKVIAEAEKVRDKAIEEEHRIESALLKARIEVEGKVEAERLEYEAKIKKLELELANAHQEAERAISNAQITTVGHVYIISNIGSFGENVYKIGMTRRDDPIERVNELGDASVPFRFDIHAVIYSENARKLESDLHTFFETKRVNKINKRKEFFAVSLEEVELACLKLNVEINITKLAEAREYRESLLLENSDNLINDNEAA
jgi:hypothetical protein